MVIGFGIITRIGLFWFRRNHHKEIPGISGFDETTIKKSRVFLVSTKPPQLF